MMNEIWFACPGEKMYRYAFIGGELHKMDEAPTDPILLPQRAVIIAGDPEILLCFNRKGYCCIGFDPEGKTFFEGAEYVVTDLEGISEDLIGRAYDHHFRRPHTIAETERLLIRESTEEDYPAIAAMMKENENSAICFFPQGQTLSKEEYLSYIGMTYRFFGFGNWCVCEKSTGEVIGWCGLNPVSITDEGKNDVSGMNVLYYYAARSSDTGETSGDEAAELGYVIRRDRRGRGYAQEACEAILQYAERELGITKCCVCIRAGNESSFRLARKLGFMD